MRSFLKVAIFALALIGLYTLFAAVYVPQITPEPPPKEAPVPAGPVTMEQFISLGESIFRGKGSCTLCHNSVGGRAPSLDNIAVTAAERLKDIRYKGSASDAEGYIYESMTNPSAYVVRGFGVAGTDDTVSPMPDVRGGTIGLAEFEIRAVIAYLERACAVPVTVKIPEQGAAQDNPKPAGVQAR